MTARMGDRETSSTGRESLLTAFTPVTESAAVSSPAYHYTRTLGRAREKRDKDQDDVQEAAVLQSVRSSDVEAEKGGRGKPA